MHPVLPVYALLANGPAAGTVTEVDRAAMSLHVKMDDGDYRYDYIGLVAGSMIKVFRFA
jgi:hypothetical protein